MFNVVPYSAEAFSAAKRADTEFVSKDAALMHVGSASARGAQQQDYRAAQDRPDERDRNRGAVSRHDLSERALLFAARAPHFFLEKK